MRTALRLLAITALVLPLVLAHGAGAQRPAREFAGSVVAIDAASITVKDRRGETATFARASYSSVHGKEGWEAVAPGDSVIVRWKLEDGTVRRVVVLEAERGGDR
jgi:hypothetical protein